MSATCGGFLDGQACPCRRCVPIPNTDPSEPVLCRDCKHIESAHPTPGPHNSDSSGLTGMITRYKEAAKIAGLRPSLKASQSDAEAETNTGLKRKNTDSDQVVAGPSKSRKAKGKVCLYTLPDVPF